MQAFEKLTATAVPLRMENVDTDQIIPAKYLTAVTKEGMGQGLFSWIRYNADGSPKADFVINNPEYAGSEILIAGRNVVVVTPTGRMMAIHSLRKLSPGTRVRVDGIKWGAPLAGIKWGVQPAGIKWGIKWAKNGTFASPAAFRIPTTRGTSSVRTQTIPRARRN